MRRRAARALLLLSLASSTGCALQPARAPAGDAVPPFARPTLVGPLVCADPSCPVPAPGGPAVNNSNFHLRDVNVGLAGDSYFYLTGTSTSAGDGFWSDVYGVVRMWRSRTLAPGSFEPGGRVVFNVTRDCPTCGDCVIPNTAACPTPGQCARVWAPEYHYLPSTLAAVPRAGGSFIALHLHCRGGFSGVLASTTGSPFGPYEAINTGVHGGDVTLFAHANGTVYAGSSGPLMLSRLSANLTVVEEEIVVGAACYDECSHALIGFEGMQFLARDGAFFLCASAYGNATAHGGPRWPAIGNETANSTIFYSTYCGRSNDLRGPFVDPVTGDPGGWLAVPKGGHNTFFTDAAGNLFSTLWYGSSARDMPPSDVPLVDLPSLVSVDVVDGRLVATGAPYTLEAGRADALGPPPGLLGNFLRSMNESRYEVSLQPGSAPLAGAAHYRLVPGLFPRGMGYHFDGLATVMSFRFDAQHLTVAARRYESEAALHYAECLFEGTGTGPTRGFRPCLTNPGVNLLPLNNQLWLTIDTAFWGRVDPTTLATVAGARVNVSSLVLNAHPACDPVTGECFVQYPCGEDLSPLTNQSCVGRLVWTAADMAVQELARATLPADKLIQHSHSPCVTPSYVVSKLDSFGARLKPGDAGLLEFLHQVEDDQWLVYHRATGAVRIMVSNGTAFVNNHFWNCFESPTTGAVVVDLVAATSGYLDAYFEASLAAPTNWTALFHAPARCTVPVSGASIACEPFWADGTDAPLFDYPTFSPLVKMQPQYEFFYAIAASSPSSKWFDRLIKVSVRSRRAIVASWASPGVFLTEASFIPHAGAQSEDDGSLVSVAYNATADASALAVFSARTLLLVSWYPLDQVIPFHAHGVTCRAETCYSNP